MTDPYPHEHCTKCAKIEEGMSLRDWFAGMALINYDDPSDKIAKRCYEIADAMINEREKP